MSAYNVNVTRDGRWWMIEIPAIDGLTQARRLAEVEDMARSYIAVTLDVPATAVTLGHVHIKADEVDISEVEAHLSLLRRTAADAEAAAAKLARETAISLSRAGVPMRDTGTVLGLSHQRVAQLIQA